MQEKLEDGLVVSKYLGLDDRCYWVIRQHHRWGMRSYPEIRIPVLPQVLFMADIPAMDVQLRHYVIRRKRC